MRIEYVFDTVCPWCYVGKRRLERALAQRPETRARIIWRPFLLNPDLPPEGIDRRTYLDRKFGGSARVQRVHAAVAAAGKTEGIEFDFESITRMPNSLNSHRLIRYAGASGREGELVEALYQAYFSQGLDIGDVEVLTSLGATIGLEREALHAFLTSDADAASVLNDNARAHRLGVNGVPCLILDSSYALAGAQEPDILLRLIDIVRESQPEAAFS
ncbi:DsbA family oxidoreductase [Paramagnetospirillum magneticum]|uniref:Predicted dithiol-disulfide isomerase involved in polyketide biosynthesis n=1 Tax=Paramagnetospirillum magneticum (strain ATCC 700264 / AMB-1) TaxID=342108 RepID=Q2W4F8_PARM1|nr:DsbA family oxidoreductase [Paramagnetospirillum magneticum]BAE51267.1 Predicted dithiol-disulfide isomerase involved in polyketide biosynthesis [Paramagnetospirillum magneticum AMB-1]